MFGREILHNFDKMLPENANPEKLETWMNMCGPWMTKPTGIPSGSRGDRSNCIPAKEILRQNFKPLSIQSGRRCEDLKSPSPGDRYEGPYYILNVLSDVNFRVARSAGDAPHVPP